MPDTTSLQHATTLVVGAGIMGAGIAQVAAQAGHPVYLADARPGAAATTKAKLASTLDGLVTKGRLSADEAAATLARITPIDQLADAADARLVVEAIFEDLAAKRALFAELEGLLGDQAILATNTSSISVTAIANGLQHPGRLVGMHFFNPVPLMKLVEVVRGLHTDHAVADAIFDLAKAWGKVPVHCASTPGFIVNRIARPYYAEALALLHERSATPAVLDACWRGAGFRLGPCELMDLIGLDTNLAVTRSVWEANYQDKRYTPSLVQREMVEGGLLGRKSGRGFYRYGPGEAGPPGLPPAPTAPVAVPADVQELVVLGSGPLAEALAAALTTALAPQGWGPAREPDAAEGVGLRVDGALLLMTDGRTADARAEALGVDALVLFDRPQALLAAAGAAGAAAGAAAATTTAVTPGTPLACAVAARCPVPWAEAALQWLQVLGFAPQPVADAPGLVVARTLAMLINEAADAVQQGVCSTEGADHAMTLGVSYPGGPFSWLAGWSPAAVIALLDALDRHYRGERYRVSPWLRREAARLVVREGGTAP